MTFAQTIHEALSLLPPGHQYVIQRLIERGDELERTLQGIASCATQCECCMMHQRIARQRLSDPYPQNGVDL